MIGVDGLEYIDKGHIYLYKGELLPSATEIVALKFQDKYKDVPEFVLEKARVKGSGIHKAIEDNFNGLFSLDYEDEVNDFFKIIEEQGLTLISMERPIIAWHKDKPICCGRLDVIVKKDEEYGIVDIKTTSKLDEEYLGYQLNIYKNGYEKTYDTKISFLGAIWLRGKKSEYKQIEIDESKSLEIFDLYLKNKEENNEQSDIEW